jgi:hypothetical protein
MRRRSILLVSYHYLPAATPGSRRLDTLARMLAQRGWDVTILTATAGGRDDRHDDHVAVVRTTRGSLGQARGRAAIASPRVSRIPLLRRATRFPDKYAPWGLSLTPRILRLLKTHPIDVVMSSSPPHSTHLAIAAARAVRRFKWVAEFRDPWMFPSRRQLSPASAAMQRRLERGVLHRADLVIANTPGNRDALLAANPGMNHARVRVSTNGYDAALFSPSSTPSPQDENADLTYVGEIYGGMLDRYLAALESIRARAPAHVPRLAVYGTIHTAEERRISALGFGAYIEHRGFVPHEESIAAMKRARALLALLPPHERWRTCVPSKIYWYLAARRPIVAIVPEGDTAALVRSMHAGHALVDGDPEAVGRDLEALVVAARDTLPPALPGEGTTRYAMDAIVDELDAALQEVIDGNPA